MRFMMNLLVGAMILCAALAVDSPLAEAGPGETIRINEIMYDPLGVKLQGEWVELYNYGSQAVNMNGWSMLDQDGDDLPSGDVDFVFPDIDFPSGAYALVHTCSGTSSTAFADGRADFYMGKTSSIWSPTGDDCLLTNGTGYPMDFVSYGQWNGTYVDDCPAELDRPHTNASSETGFSIALVPDRFIESFPTPLHSNGQEDESNILITEVYYDTWGKNEYAKIFNPNAEPVDISFWYMTDGEGLIAFPDGTEMAPGQSLTISQNATNYEAAVLDLPDLEYFDLHAGVRDMIVPDYEPTLANDGDELFLFNQFRTQIDAFVYGGSDYAGTGWDSEPVPDLRQGRIAKRLNITGYQDTNTSQDWLAARPYVIGQSDFQPGTFRADGPIRLFSSPDSAFSVICDVLDNATVSIDLNLYEFTNTHLADRLLAAVSRGVDARLFLEGSPVSGMNETQLFIARQIVESGGEVRILTNDPDNDIHARYNFDHAKYAVIDDETLIIMSENWGRTSVPPVGELGNRGWGAAIQDSDTARYFSSVFQEDWNPLRADSVAFDSNHEKWDSGHDWSRNGTECGPRFSSITIDTPSDIVPVLSPDTSLSNSTVLEMLESANERVMVEQFYIYKHWGDKSDGSPEENPNIYLEAVLDAARRGCQTRILLDSTYYNVEASDPVDNDDTVEYVNSIAEAENLNLEAKLVNLDQHDFLKIHNKGMIVDDSVLISSINWNLNSVTENRETGVIIRNRMAADFFAEIFEYDWKDDTTPPLAQFAHETAYQVNTTVNFSASASFDNVGITNYTWLLDGESMSWDENYSCAFTKVGVCRLNLTLSDAWGNRGWVEYPINITYDDISAGDTGEDGANGDPDGLANETAEQDDPPSEILAVLLLTPVVIFLAVLIARRLRNR